MGRAPCCSKVGLHRGPWTPREDALLTNYLHAHGEGQWRSLPKKAGLLRCGKSCRLRWMNYLRPDIKRGNITPEEDDLIIRMHSLLGNRWSLIAGRLPGRTDNEIKNYWNTHLSKKLKNQASSEPDTHKNKLLCAETQKKKGKKKSHHNSKKQKDNTKTESEKTLVYLPKPIRVKDLSRRDLDSSATRSQENKDVNMVCRVGDDGDIMDAGFGFFDGDDHDLVNTCDVESEYCDSIVPTYHTTLEELYEEYLQLLKVQEDNPHELDSFAQSLLA
ncbi:hypothetical protein RJT34_20544 [Clitoria ternatea]|uniref:MYB transcription factor n=1 Tax=Clitoria ternatea TaxID=43366 RepID=A0AAN9ITN7_CLITE